MTALAVKRRAIIDCRLRLNEMTQLYSGGFLFKGEGEILDSQSVLVENGKIIKVAPSGEFDGFAGETVDTSGGTLMPGLFDCHVHLCL